MPKKATGKLYRLGADISWKDTNRLLGRPVNTPLTWQEFQDHAERRLLRLKQKILT